MATITNTSTLADILLLDQLPVEEQAAFLDEVGALIMESATVKYLAEADIEAQESFINHLAQHQQDDTFLEVLLQTFPDFASVMADEVVAFESDMRRVLAE